MLTREAIPYGGWKRCLRIANREVDLIITLDVGPRIIRCGFIGESNIFVEYAEQMGKTGGPVYRSYGGHRLWIAPEEQPKTYYPDNEPVEWKQRDDWISFMSPPELSTGFQKEIRVNLHASDNKIRIHHRVTNLAKHPQTFAAWALSVMAPGGLAILPHERFRQHTEYLLPVRPLVFWAYTDMTDPRWTWGKKFIQLRQDVNSATPQKIGALNTDGWLAYFKNGTIFMKRFPVLPDRTYPDFGSNCEIFTNQKMLELESLSSLATLGPGESVEHEEQWHLFRGIHFGPKEEDLEKGLMPLLGKFQ